jgi:glycerol-3-phosphate acyltransferase PlsY
MVSQGILFALAAYLLGSVPFGKLVAKRVSHVDITALGSGNIGAANVAREIGLKWGLLTLALDMLKGFIPVVLFSTWASQMKGDYDIAMSMVCLSSFLGSQFSLFLRFRGGKGVGTAAGIYLAISPLSCLLALLLFFLIVYKWTFISLGSIVSASSMPFLLIFFGKAPPPVVVASFLMAASICFRHRENILRLVKGEETKWRKEAAKPEDQEAFQTPHRNKKI